jgi:hypothetical protein
MRSTPYLLLLIAIAFVLGGCAAATQNKNLGSMKESNEITQKYRSLTIDPAYHYYYSGVELNPDVVMGIEKSYTVESKFWHQIDLSKDRLEYWVTWGDRQSMDEGFSRRYLGKYRGAYILAPDGTVVGDWYSKKDWGIFEFPGNNVIIPHPPRNRYDYPRRIR